MNSNSLHSVERRYYHEFKGEYVSSSNWISSNYDLGLEYYFLLLSISGGEVLRPYYDRLPELNSKEFETSKTAFNGLKFMDSDKSGFKLLYKLSGELILPFRSFEDGFSFNPLWTIENSNEATLALEEISTDINNTMIALDQLLVHLHRE
jgi:hypothetical protein